MHIKAKKQLGQFQYPDTGRTRRTWWYLFIGKEEPYVMSRIEEQYFLKVFGSLLGAPSVDKPSTKYKYEHS